MEVTKVLHLVKSTAGTHVYGEQGVDRREAIFPALYLPKTLFPNGQAVPTVTVTLKI